mgnify:CR=1 FL=1
MTEKTIKKFGKNKSDSGSTEAQVALFTDRINQLNEHLKSNKKDNSSRRGLMTMVSKMEKSLHGLFITQKQMKQYLWIM